MLATLSIELVTTRRLAVESIMRSRPSPESTALGAISVHFLRSFFAQFFNRPHHSSGRVYDIVDYDTYSPAYIADHIHFGYLVGTAAAFVYQGYLAAFKPLRQCSGSHYSACIRRYHCDLFGVFFCANVPHDVFGKHRRAVDVVDRNGKEALQLFRVQIERTVRALHR